MRENSAAVLRTNREALEQFQYGCSLPATPTVPPTEAELAKESDRPDLDYLQDLREAEGLGDHYTQYGVIEE